jgi:hypothetical protein
MMTSAFWHGFYPIYYVIFFAFAILTENTRDILRIKPLLTKLVPSQIIQQLLCNVYCLYYVGFFMATHFALEVQKGITVAEAFYFMPYISIMVVFAIFKVSGFSIKYQRSLESITRKDD